MQKVFVGLSGGVDSAVSAALLQREGYEVTGVFIKIWSPEFLECTWREDRLSAKRVAAHLGIRFLEIDLSKEYREKVISNMLETYQNGQTPNPDVLCNTLIKFGAFADWALANGAEMIATGHYARIKKNAGQFQLLKAIDPAKDQSYFLHKLSQKDLSHTLFPVGGFTKPQIRAKAQEFNLPNANRPDSQGLCFVGDITLPEFLQRFITLSPGEILYENGAHIGKHPGAAQFTVGQRHGFQLSSDAPEGPYYVKSIDAKRNTVVVTKEKSKTMHASASLRAMHWIQREASEAEAVSRYHGQSVRARIQSAGESPRVELGEPLQLTPGQSLVFYDGETCLGGGVIQSAA